jgi:hypothetical protein
VSSHFEPWSISLWPQFVIDVASRWLKVLFVSFMQLGTWFYGSICGVIVRIDSSNQIELSTPGEGIALYVAHVCCHVCCLCVGRRDLLQVQ